MPLPIFRVGISNCHQWVILIVVEHLAAHWATVVSSSMSDIPRGHSGKPDIGWLGKTAGSTEQEHQELSCHKVQCA